MKLFYVINLFVFYLVSFPCFALIPEFSKNECSKFIDIIKADKQMRENGTRLADDYNHIHYRESYNFKDSANYTSEFIKIKYIGDINYTESHNAGMEIITYSKSGTKVTKLIACTVNFENNKFTYHQVDPKQVKETYGNYNFYDDNMITKFEYPNIQNGSYTVLICTKEHSHIKGMPNGTSMSFFTYWHFDILQNFDHKISITLPKNIKHHLHNEKGVGLIKNFDVTKNVSGNQLNYSLYMDKSTKLKWEYQSVINSDLGYIPYIQFSTIKSWNDIKNTIFSEHEKIISNGKQILIDEIAKIAKFFSISTDKLTAFHVFHYVQSKFRYVYAHTGSGSHIPNSIETIIKNASGDCKDHAVLLVGLLRILKLKAYPVLIRTSETKNLNLKTPSIEFDHEIVALYNNNNNITFLDATHKFIPFNYLPKRNCNRNYIMLKDSKLVTGTTPVQKEEKILFNQEVTINSDASCSTTTKLNFYGSSYEHLAYTLKMNTSDEDLKNKILNQYLFGESSKVLNYKVDNLNNFKEPLEITINGTGQNCVLIVNNMYILKPFVFVNSNVYNEKSRLLPLEFSDIINQNINISVTIPDNFEIQYIPNNFDYNFNSLSVKSTYQKISQRTVKILQLFAVKKDVIMPDKYSQFKDNMQKLKKHEHERIVFIKKD